MLVLPPAPLVPMLTLGFEFPPLAPKLVRPLKLVRPGALPLIERRRSPSDEPGRVGIITCTAILGESVECDALVARFRKMGGFSLKRLGDALSRDLGHRLRFKVGKES
jgi:hypothetical protein